MSSVKSEEEAWYRLSLAQGRLRRTVEAFERGDYLGCVLEAQLSVENAAKAVIAVFRIPSWSHDPSVELREVITRNRENMVRKLGADFMSELEELASTAEDLAPEHGRATYGNSERRIPPWEIFTEEDAREASGRVKRAYETAEKLVKKWYE